MKHAIEYYVDTENGVAICKDCVEDYEGKNLNKHGFFDDEDAYCQPVYGWEEQPEDVVCDKCLERII